MGCINTVAVSGFLFVNLSGCGFLVTHFLLACRQPGQMVTFVSLYSYTCMCVVVVLNTNMCMSQCLLVICGFNKRINFPLSLYRSNLANPVALVLNTCKILNKATGKYMIALYFSCAALKLGFMGNNFFIFLPAICSVVLHPQSAWLWPYPSNVTSKKAHEIIV